MPLLQADFDHSYIVVNSLAGFERLGKSGFSIPERTVEHPGGVHCQFIYFPAVPGAVNGGGRRIQYLEFVSIPDLTAYKQFEDSFRAAQGLGPRSVEEITNAGFSLCATGLEKRFEGVKTELAGFQPTFEHRNYNWKTVKERAAGWNYLKFGRPLSPVADIWLTEYEDDPSRAGIQSVPHANGCSAIVGAIWDCGKAEMEPLAKLSGSSLTDDTLTLGDGFRIYFGGKNAAALGANGGTNSFRALILTCDNLERFNQVAKPDAQGLTLFGKRASVLQPYPNGWSLVVTES